MSWKVGDTRFTRKVTYRLLTIKGKQPNVNGLNYSIWRQLQFSNILPSLTHWGGVTHICVCKLIIIGSDNGSVPGRRRAMIWTNAEILIEFWERKFDEILIEISIFSFKKMHLNMSLGKWRPFCLGLNLLTKSD